MFQSRQKNKSPYLNATLTFLRGKYDVVVTGLFECPVDSYPSYDHGFLGTLASFEFNKESTDFKGFELFPEYSREVPLHCLIEKRGYVDTYDVARISEISFGFPYNEINSGGASILTCLPCSFSRPNNHLAVVTMVFKQSSLSDQFLEYGRNYHCSLKIKESGSLYFSVNSTSDQVGFSSLSSIKDAVSSLDLSVGGNIVRVTNDLPVVGIKFEKERVKKDIHKIRSEKMTDDSSKLLIAIDNSCEDIFAPFDRIITKEEIEKIHHTIAQAMIDIENNNNGESNES